MQETQTLADLRRHAGLSQRQVGDALDWTQGQVSRFEAQYPDVKIPALQAYLKVIGMTVRYVGFDFGEINSLNVVPDPARQEYRRSRGEDPTRSRKRSEVHSEEG